MKAFVVARYGKNEVRAADVPEPRVGNRDVLVKVSAASINPLDIMVRNGEFKQLLKYKTPFVLGHDVAGVVTEVGADVRGFAVGDEVLHAPATFASGPSRSTSPSTKMTSRSSRPPCLCTRPQRSRWSRWPPGRSWSRRHTSSPGRRFSSTPAPEGWGPPSSSLPSISGHTWRPPPTAPERNWSATSEPTSSSTTPQQDFAEILSDYDLVLDSLGGENLIKSLTVLKPGGLAIGVTGPPDAGFAKQLGAPKPFEFVLSFLSRKVRKAAKKLGVRY